ncbi:MAG: hypothetical protein O3B01_22800 [Planctomycetota bacterium]|nr:hypothetical protein [Planctomycetota bacterium]MDA1141400.1 hypothetical protein [Planctomycetota bacterium]
MINLGSQRELFVDHYLIESLNGASLRMHPPIRREVVFQAEQPGENPCTGCYNLCRDEDRILMYYRGYYPLNEKHGDGAESQTTNLVTSLDGIHFERPNFGLFEFRGSKDNNIIYQGQPSHNFCVFRDDNPDADPGQRFKAVGGSGTDNLHGFCSPDGIHWDRIQSGPLKVTGAFDSINVPLWDPHAGCYRLFSRYFSQGGFKGVRAIQSCTSNDFIHWTEPKPHVYDQDVPREHFYTNATVPCPGAEQILLSFPMRFIPERTRNTEGMDYPGEGLSDAIFMSSRDGVHWDRTFMEGWVRPGLDQKNWTHRSLTTAVGIFETADDEWSIYISENYGWPTNRVRRVTIRPFGFASLFAGYHGGEAITKPLTYTGRTLRLNYATSAAGSVAVEVQQEDGTPIQGFALNEMPPMFGDELDAAVSWNGGSDLSHLAGRSLRFRFKLKDADIYALRFSD